MKFTHNSIYQSVALTIQNTHDNSIVNKITFVVSKYLTEKERV